MLWILALILAFAPGAALLWYIRHIDQYEPEPWKSIGLAFMAGCISTVPALFVELFLDRFHYAGFLGTVWSAFIVASLTEEVSKGGLAYLFMWRRPEFNEVMDGIVYFGVAHMGFAITENLLYIFVFSQGDIAQAIMTGFARTTTAVPLHVLAGMIMGYHLGVARYAKSWQVLWRNRLQALAYPVFLHGIYDLAAFNQSIAVQDVASLLRASFGTALLYAAVVALWLFLLPRVKAAQEASPWKPHGWPSLPVAGEPCARCGAAYPLEANYCHLCAQPTPASAGQR